MHNNNIFYAQRFPDVSLTTKPRQTPPLKSLYHSVGSIILPECDVIRRINEKDEEMVEDQTNTSSNINAIMNVNHQYN